MIEDKKKVVIEDSIYLDLHKLGWGYNIMGPVTHPIMMDNSLIHDLLTARQAVKFMYCINSKDSSKRIKLTLDNYNKTETELFKNLNINSTQINITESEAEPKKEKENLSLNNTAPASLIHDTVDINNNESTDTTNENYGDDDTFTE